jgi:pyruvate dehydrogenase E2 component (dihydrolipoamide acetyltransferase)
METGTISKWNVKEGDKFEAGQAIAEVETDKASVVWEATDDGFIARILGGDGEVKVGSPVLITVEEQEHIAAFANYKVASSSASAPAPVSTPAPAASAAVATPAVSKPAPAPTPAAPVAASSSSIPASAISSVRWSDVQGNAGSRAGAIGFALAAAQNAYVSKWGFSGFQPAPLPKPSAKKAKV